MKIIDLSLLLQTKASSEEGEKMIKLEFTTNESSKRRFAIGMNFSE